MTTLPATIQALATRIAAYRDRRVRLTESDTIRVLILPILEALGWDLQDVEEVRSEYRRVPSDNPVDYALFLDASPALFVEAKALGVSLDDRKSLMQTLNYANGAGVNWCALTNGAEWRIYKVHAPVAAEEKLFLTLRLDDQKTAMDTAANILSLLSRDRLQAKVGAIDALWSEWRVDRQVEAALEEIPGDEAFIRLIAKRAPGLTAGEVRGSLRRAGLRSFYPKIDAFMARVEDQAPVLPADGGKGEPCPAADGADAAPAPRKARTRLMRTTEMVEAGLLVPGDTLTIQARPDSAATVKDGKTVEFRGDVMSFNEWGCLATGWTAIQIYKHAVMPDGRLLEALRGA